MTELIVLSWLACGFIAYGLAFAYFQREFPSIAREYYWSDVRFALLVGAFGPIGLLPPLIFGSRHGFKIK